MLSRERAQEIIRQAKEKATCGPWVDWLDKVMSSEERQMVNTYWNSLPSSTCFADALFDIAQGTAFELG